MANGRIIHSKKDQLDYADQFHTITDEKLRAHFIGLADQITEEQRQEVIDTYGDMELASAFRSFRTFNKLNSNGFTKGKGFREVYRIPAGAVYEFLKAVFEPFYGPLWMRNKKVLRHELVKPWWIVPKI